MLEAVGELVEEELWLTCFSFLVYTDVYFVLPLGLVPGYHCYPKDTKRLRDGPCDFLALKLALICESILYLPFRHRMRMVG